MNLSAIIKSIRELGFQRVWFYVRYQLGLRSGYYRMRTTDRLSRKIGEASPPEYHPTWIIPDRQALHQVLGSQGLQRLLAEADRIVAGQVRLFGAESVPLQLALPGPLVHWTAYTGSNVLSPAPFDAGYLDIKFTWEPARFGWAYTLGQAYLASGDERYPQAFWKFAEIFLDANPPYNGPNWASGQEVALRLIAFSFALQVFASSTHSNVQRTRWLTRSIAVHAARIPFTLSYAHAQNNNHLLSEAVGLYTAATSLPGHLESTRWRRLGWKWFNHGIQSQVDEDGAYIQHSTNYHRLMLQLATWFDCLAKAQNQSLPELTRQRLSAATSWLLSLVDPTSGQVPNLGPNDGAYIQPLTVCLFNDFRPTLQVAGRVFTGQRPFPPGAWDDMALWFRSAAEAAVEVSRDQPAQKHVNSQPISRIAITPHILIWRDRESWAYLRVARFHSRPGHADQLSLDLWWRGMNIAQDAGTYLYSAPQPWDNALTHTMVHNTVTIEKQEQMMRTGRFLYLDWAQATALDGVFNEDGTWRRLVTRHDGYRRLGVTHQRVVEARSNVQWVIEDSIMSVRPGSFASDAQFLIRLHWLLPDWPWDVDGNILQVHSPHGPVQLAASVKDDMKPDGRENYSPKVCLARAGEQIYGTGGVQPTWGWVSPTYGVRLPALSFSVAVNCKLPVCLKSEWLLGIGAT